MAQRKIGTEEPFVVQVDHLFVDWTLLKKKSEADREADYAGFRERVRLLFDDVQSDRWHDTIWNFFDVTGRQRQEDAYTRAIASLMDPRKAHGLKDAFLKAFFEAIRKPVPPGTLECRVEVKKRIGKAGEVDIEVAGAQWRLVVENKIDSKENQGQTEKYAAYYKRSYILNKNLFLVYLSPLRNCPLSHDFIPMSYRDLRHVLESVKPAGDAEIFVRHMINHIFQLET